MQVPGFKNYLRLPNDKIDRSKISFYFLLFYPSLFVVSYHLITASILPKKEFLGNLLLTSAALLFCNFLPFKWLRFLYLFLLLVLTYAIVFIEISYFTLFDTSISKSTIYILLETNISEASDFLTVYFNGQIQRIALALWVPFAVSIALLPRVVLSCRYFFNRLLKLKTKSFRPLTLNLFLLFLLGGFFVAAKIYQANPLYLGLKYFQVYQKDAKEYRLLSKDKYGGQFSSVSSGNNEEELNLVIIGESTTRHHMGLYNYYRDTNPLLKGRKSELIVYTDVISPHTHTIYSLEKVLTLANYEHPEKKKAGSLLQLMNKAGFETYWISNQNPIGMDETFVTSIARSAANTYFTNTKTWETATPYDDQVLVPLKRILTKKAKKKFIVLHLMGTHFNYTQRYSPEFDRFRDTPATVFQTSEAYTSINAYDNAVLYNDYIVNSAIDLVKKQNKPSYVVYFSDHGEEVYETKNMGSHQEEDGTKAMYDIPFFIWFSDKYKQQDKNHQYATDRKYMTDDLIYTIADLSNVRFAEFDSTRSLVSPAFSERKRCISKDETYDLKFLAEEQTESTVH